MMCPFVVTRSLHDRFKLWQLDEWINAMKPTQIEMNDAQFSHFATLNARNAREYKGIPIVFTDAPKDI